MITAASTIVLLSFFVPAVYVLSYFCHKHKIILLSLFHLTRKSEQQVCHIINIIRLTGKNSKHNNKKTLLQHIQLFTYHQPRILFGGFLTRTLLFSQISSPLCTHKSVHTKYQNIINILNYRYFKTLVYNTGDMQSIVMYVLSQKFILKLALFTFCNMLLMGCKKNPIISFFSWLKSFFLVIHIKCSCL